MARKELTAPPLVSIGPGMWTREIPPESRRPSREFIEKILKDEKMTSSVAELIDEAFPRELDTPRSTS